MELLRDPEVWVAISFVIFVLLTVKPIARVVVKGLDSRAAKIKAQLDEARALRDEAERLLAEHQRKQIAAAKEAEAQAVADVRNHAVDIAMAAAAKLLKDGIDSRKGDELIDSAIKELERK